MEHGIVKKTINWLRQSNYVIEQAGGIPAVVIGMMPEDLLETLIRNDIYLVHLPVDMNLK